MGHKKYYEYLNILSFEIDDLDIPAEDKKQMKESGLTTFDLMITFCDNDDFLIKTVEAFKLFFDNSISYSPDNKEFYIGEGVIHRDNYHEVKEILMLQNGIKNESDHQYNPANEEAKKLAEEMAKIKEQINKIKSKTGEKLDLHDLVSAFCSRSLKYKPSDVGELTVYQFNNQFKRLQLIENYDIGIQSLLHGADPKKVELKTYYSKM